MYFYFTTTLFECCKHNNICETQGFLKEVRLCDTLKFTLLSAQKSQLFFCHSSFPFDRRSVELQTAWTFHKTSKFSGLFPTLFSGKLRHH